MLKVGITGGIGSGKSVVCQVFNTLGIPVFDADAAARFLMEQDTTLVAGIKQLLGDDVYDNGILQRPKIAALVFANPEKLQALNALVHPATIAYGQQWMETQTSPYVLKEAAIFFESGSYKDMDIMIGVYAPAALRIARAMKRSGASHTEIEQRMAQQMNEEEKMKRCDYVITNDEQTAIIPQVLSLHNTLLQRSNS